MFQVKCLYFAKKNQCYFIRNIISLNFFLSDLRSKSCRGKLTLWANGSGKIIINGHDGIDYFNLFQSREQVKLLIKTEL